MKIVLTVLGLFLSAAVFAHPVKFPCVTGKNLNNNQNGSLNKNQNANQNANQNTNTNNNANDVKVNVKVGTTSPAPSVTIKHKHSSNSSSSSSSSSSGNGFNGMFPFPGNTFAPQFTDARSPSFAPSAGTSPSYGASGYAAPAGYVGAAMAPGYSVPMPTLNGVAEDPNTAWLTVDVPNDQAEVYLNGVKMPHKGVSRKYVTPPLNPKQTYNYALKVVWPDATGNKKTYNANIELKAGDEIHHVVPNPANNVVPPMPKEGPAPPMKAKIPDDKEDQVRDLEIRLQNRLKFAKQLMDAGKKDKARKWLNEIVEEYPETKAANDAKFLLKRLN